MMVYYNTVCMMWFHINITVPVILMCTTTQNIIDIMWYSSYLPDLSKTVRLELDQD